MTAMMVANDDGSRTSFGSDSLFPESFSFEGTENFCLENPDYKNYLRESNFDRKTLSKENLASLTREERRKLRRATTKYKAAHASRERMRVVSFNNAFTELRQLLPTLPPDKKLSKIEILRLAICYISYLTHMLDVAKTF